MHRREELNETHLGFQFKALAIVHNCRRSFKTISLPPFLSFSGSSLHRVTLSVKLFKAYNVVLRSAMNCNGENTTVRRSLSVSSEVGGNRKAEAQRGFKFELGVWKCGTAGPGTLRSNQTVTILLPNDIATCIDGMISSYKPR